jgi:hypothetical protein
MFSLRRRINLESLGQELPPAMLAAKVEGLPVTLGAQRLRFIDGHAANGIDRHVVALPNAENRTELS